MKHKFTATLALALLAIGVLGSVTSVNAADLNNSIYVPLDAPCRVGDTRNLTPQRVPAGDHVEWFAYGTSMTNQGGEAGGCPQPKTDMTPTGIAVNITAYGPQATGRGNLVAYPADAVTAPTASIVNYYPIPAIPDPSIANSTFVGLCQTTACDGKFKIQSNNSAVPVIADVQGYFYARPSGIAQVAIRGGDYSSPVDAMNDLDKWCGTPSATNTCLMKIAPGVYSVDAHPIMMQEWVSIQGSGQEVTEIAGTLGGDAASAVVHGANHASLTDLTIVNTGGSGGDHSIGIHNEHASPRIQQVAVNVSGGDHNTGISNQDSSSPTITDVSIRAEGGINTHGMKNGNGSALTMTDVHIKVLNAGGNAGIVNENTDKMLMKGGSINASHGQFIRGIQNSNARGISIEGVKVIVGDGTFEVTGVSTLSSNVTIINCQILADGGSNIIGEAIAINVSKLATTTAGSETFITGSYLWSRSGHSPSALFIGVDNPQTRIVNNSIQGKVTNLLKGEDKRKACRGNYDENFQVVTCM